MTIEMIVVNAQQQSRVVNLVKGESIQIARGDTIRIANKVDIKTFRKGNDLVIKNESGEEFVLNGFYDCDGEEQQLLSWDDEKDQEKEILSTECIVPVVAGEADAVGSQVAGNDAAAVAAEGAADKGAAAVLAGSSGEPNIGLLGGIAALGFILLQNGSGGSGGGGAAPVPQNNPIGAVSDSHDVPNNVADQAANGTTVGIIALAVDPDAGSTVTYSLINNAGGRFAIDPDTGVVTVANGAALDHASAQSHVIRVLATSSDGTTSQGDFTINVVGATPPATPAAPVSYNDNVGTIQNPTSVSPVTDDTTPGVNVGASLTDTPSLYVDGVKVPATYNSVTGTLTPNTPLSEGLHALTYTLTGATGLESAQSPAFNLTIDTTPPATPAAPASYNDNVGTIQNPTSVAPVTDDATPGINIGTGLTDVPTLYVDGIQVPATYDSVTGTLTPNTQLSEGLHALTYTLTDPAGNESAQSAPLNLTIESTVPTQTIAIDSISLDSGTAGDFITNDNDGLTVNATLSAVLGTGETLEYSNDNGATWSDVTASVAGTAVSVVDPLLTSTNTVQFRVADGANTGAVASQLVTIDTTAPTQTLTIDSISLDSGTAGDFITNDNDGLTVNATLSAVLGTGETLEYSNDNGATWSDVTASVAGTAVSVVDPLLTSTNTVQFRVADGANTGAVASQLVTIDTTAPTQTLTIDSISLDSGISGDFITNDNDGLTVNATLSAVLGTGETLEYSNDNGATWSDVTASVAGTAVSVVDPLLTSTNTVQFRVADGANTGAVASQLVTIDTTAPDAPEINWIAINDVVDATEAAAGITISGTGEIGATVTLTFSSGTTLAGGNTALVDGAGNWSVAVTTADITAMGQNPESVTATQADVANNVSGSTIRPFTIDTIAPTAITLSPADNLSSASPNANLVVTFSENIFAGTGNVRIVNDTDSTTTTIAIGSPEVSIVGNTLTINPTADLLQGKAYHIEIDSGALVDGVGNVYTGIGDSTTWNFGIGDPSISVNLIATDNIVNALENTGVITVSGTVFSSVPAVLTDLLASDITVVLNPQGGGSPINVTVTSYNNVTGVWSGNIPANTFDPALNAVANKLYDVAASFLGTTGNAAGYNAATASLVTVDTVAPTQTVIINSISLDTGIAGDFITSDNNGLIVNATLSAPLNAGEILQYSNNNGATWADVTTSVAGTAITVVDAALTSTNTVQFRVADAAANIGTAASQLITIDTTAPTQIITINSISDDTGTPADFITNDNDGLTVNATLSAILNPGETLQYSNNNGATWTDVTGSVSGTAVAVVDPLLTSTNTVRFRVADGANYGTVASQLVIIDTVAPTQIINITAITNDTGVAGDFITADNNGLVVSGTLTAVLNAGETLQYSNDNGATWTNITGSVTGTAISHFDAALTSSTTVQMRVADGANFGPVKTQAIVIDTVAPTQTITINSISLDSGTPADFITNDNNGLTVNATLSAILNLGETLQYSNDNGATWTDVTGSVSGTVVAVVDPLLTSTNTVRFRVTDGASFGPVASQLVTIDTVAPTQGITIDSISLDTGTPGDFITSDNDGLTVNATLTAALGVGEVLQYSNNNGASWTNITSSVTGTAVSYFDAGLTLTDTVQMRISDGANYGTTVTQLVTIDTDAPTQTITVTAISTDTGIVGDFITSDNDGLTVSATLSATLDPGETLEYSNDNGATWTDVTASVSGIAVSVIDPALTSTNTVQFRVADGANYGTAATRLVTIDTVAPTQTIAINSISLDTGTPADFITADNNGLTINATLSAALGAGEALLYSNNNGVSWIDATASISGGTTVTVVDPLLTSTNTVRFIVADLAGNLGTGSSQLVTIDATPPDAPIINAIATNDVVDATEAAAGITISGTGEPGATVTLTFSSGTTLAGGNTALVDGAGNWSVAVTTADITAMGQIAETVTATQADIANNVSDSTNRTFTIDTIAPTAIIEMSDTALKIGDVSTVTITFSEAVTNFNSTADVTTPNGALSLMTSGDGGITWTGTFTPTAGVEDATNVISLATTYTDLAGNTGTIASSANYVVDTLAPLAPTGLDLAAADDTFGAGTAGTDADNITRNTTGLTISGTAEAGSTVQLFRDVNGNGVIDAGELLNTVTAAAFATGADISLAEGVHSIKAIATDAAGNAGPASAALTITVDTSVVTGSIVLTNYTDNGPSSTDFISNDNTFDLTLSGAEIGASVQWQRSTNGGATWIDTTAAQSALANNTYHYRAIVTDVAGNTANTATQVVVVDTVAAAPTMALANDSGASSSDRYTNVPTVNVSGLEIGASWQYQIDGGAWINGSGSTFNLTNGAHNYAVRQTDLAGNTSAPSSQLSMTLDTAVTALTSNISATNASILNISGIDADATWQYAYGSSGWINGTGSSINLESLMNSVSQISLRQTDLAGNISTTASPYYVTGGIGAFSAYWDTNEGGWANSATTFDHTPEFLNLLYNPGNYGPAANSWNMVYGRVRIFDWNGTLATGDDTLVFDSFAGSTNTGFSNIWAAYGWRNTTDQHTFADPVSGDVFANMATASLPSDIYRVEHTIASGTWPWGSVENFYFQVI